MVEDAPQKFLKVKLAAVAAGLLLVVLVFAGFRVWKKRRSPASLPLSAILGATAPQPPDPYREAVGRVEQDRGEPTGNKADIKVPAELKLYNDKKLFLAIQIAEAREQKYEIPHDFAELAAMIRRGGLEKLPTFGPDYVLYGVGLRANDELTHYDEKDRKSVPLFASEGEIGREVVRLGDAVKENEKKLRELGERLARAGKSDRAARDELVKQVADVRKSVEENKKRRELIASFYESKEHRRLMAEEYETLRELARDFAGRSFDLADPQSRKEFKVYMLSVLRPPAISMMREIGAAYRQKFGRLLPLTSLMRTKEYQRYLNEQGNPNAVKIDLPPHTTGLAFDVFTYYMTAAEQQFLIDEIARLKREGRVEALRENRFHIHVFAFADGRPPDASLVRKAESSAAPNGEGGQ